MTSGGPGLGDRALGGPGGAAGLAAESPAERGTGWVFTFGSDHRLLISGAEDELPGRIDYPGAGFSLAHRYVRVPITGYEPARAWMLRTFGNHWCDQYPDNAATALDLIARHGLRELPL